MSDNDFDYDEARQRLLREVFDDCARYSKVDDAIERALLLNQTTAVLPLHNNRYEVPVVFSEKDEAFQGLKKDLLSRPEIDEVTPEYEGNEGGENRYSVVKITIKAPGPGV